MVINRFSYSGIYIMTNGGNTMEGNYIGTDVTGSLDLGNVKWGISVRSANNTIGGTTPGSGNLISGNDEVGVDIVTASASSNVVYGNFIGTNAAGTADLGNTLSGVSIAQGAANNIVGNTGSARNIISGNDQHGVRIVDGGSSNNRVQNNYIGVDVTGNNPIGNGWDGVRLEAGLAASGNVGGGTTAGLGNVISGNSVAGIHIWRFMTATLVAGNIIGRNASNTAAVANTGPGIVITSSNNNTIGGTTADAANTIASNGGDGIAIIDTFETATGNALLRNSIFSNGGLGIDLSDDGVTANDALDADTGPNDLLNFPQVLSVLGSGTLTAYFRLDLPAGSYRVEFFKNSSGPDPSGNGEGQTFVSSTNVTHPGGGSADFNHTFAGSVGDVITATTTVCTDAPTCAAFGSTSELSNAVTAVPTSVELMSFRAIGRDQAVDLFWDTGSELNNLGFHLYRSLSAAGPYERITSLVIPGLGSSPMGAAYTYRDRGLTNEATYYYKLEDIETTGKAEMHGPVSATPEAGDAGGSAPGENTGRPRITVGDPSSSTLRVVSDRDGVVLELVTGGFYATALEDGTFALEVPGYDLTTEVGAPSLPVRRTWVQAVAGRSVQVASVERLDEQTFDDFQLPLASEPMADANRRGIVQSARSRLRREDRDAGVYPTESARVVSVGYQEDVKKALVEMAPFRWDGNRLVLARRLVVRLSFRGRDPDDGVGPGGARRYRRPPSHAEREVSARLVTRERGLYGVSFEEVFGSASRGTVRLDSLRLSRQGETAPFHVSAPTWGPGSMLYFVSDGAAANPYGREAVYELEVGVAGRQMATGSGSPTGEPTPYYWNRVEKEENLMYQSTLLKAPDPWLWSVLFAPARKSYPFEVSALAAAGESSHLSVWIQGASDFDADPDHHVRLYVNGDFVAEAFWNGKEPHRIEAELGAGRIHEGENLLAVENAGDTGADYSMAILDRFEVTYPRLLQAVEGQLEGRWSVSGTAEVTGLTEAILLEEGPSGFIWLEGAESSATAIRFGAEADRSYLAVHPDAVKKVAAVRRPVKSRLKQTRNRADYVMIGPRDFVDVAWALAEHRRRQGLRVQAVPLDEVFSEFGFGEEVPNAIKDFLSFAYHRWEKAPRYVLLLGDGTYDFKDYMGTGVVNRVPPLLVKTSYLETASDPAYAAVNGEDLLPDLAIGRLPAATVKELAAMIAKIIAWETSGKSLQGRAVIVTDNPDGAGDFVADAETLATTILSAQEVEKIYLSELGTAATRDEIQLAFNEGSSLMSYIGHGGIHLWAEENVFSIDDVDSLSPQSAQPLLLTMNCLNGYFHFPYFNALAEALLKAEDKGAIAAFSPSGLSLNYAANAFHKAVLEELLEGRHQRLGDALLAAQATYAEWGALPETLAIYHLFGDPALKIQ